MRKITREPMRIKKPINKLKLITIALALVILSSPVLAAMESVPLDYIKDEVVYSIISPTGEALSVYVVNTITPSEPGTFADKGKFKSVINVTNGDPLLYNDGIVEGVISGSDFTYQGELDSNALPWKFVISYELDGFPVDPKHITGANGHLVIRVGVVRNPDVPTEYFDNCSLQTQIPLPRNVFANVTTRGANIVKAGADNMAVSASMAGTPQYIVVESDVTNFEMGAIQFSALPSSVSVTMPNISEWTAQLESLTGAIASLENGISQISTGSASLASGITDVFGGLDSLLPGIDELNKAAEPLVSAYNEISETISSAMNSEAVSASLQAFGESLAAYAGNVTAALSGTLSIAEGGSPLATAASQLSASLAALKEGAATLSTSVASLPADVQGKIEELISSYDKSSYAPTSFADPSNGIINSIQFVVMTQSFSMKTPEFIQEAPENSTSAWQKFTGLFD